MERQIRQSLIKIMVFIGLLLLGGLFDILGIKLGMRAFSMAYYFLLGIFFAERLSERIVDGRVRSLLFFCAWMMVFFVLLRGMKYHAFHGAGMPARMLWYLYYVPTILIPYLSLLTAFCVDVPREKKLSPLAVVFAVPTIFMIFMVLSNDLHQLVFQFQPGFEDWDEMYGHGILYYVIVGWISMLFLGTIFELTKKCRLSAGKKFFWIPFLPFFGGLAYVITYAMGVPPKVNGYNLIEFPEMTCFVIACFWECCITIGLIPSNKGYEKLFMESEIAAQIADREFQTVYASGVATELTTEQKVAGEELALSENLFLHRADIRGGYVYWQSDVSELNRVNDELQDLKEQLAEETELIRLQNELAEKRAEIEEKSRVYDAIAKQVLPQSQRIAELAQEAGMNGASYEQNAGKICFYGTFIKRYANLMLLSENHRRISAKELGLAIDESLRALRGLGVPATLSGGADKDLETRRAMEIYASLQTLLEMAGKELQGVTVTLTDKECKAVLEVNDGASTKRKLEDDIFEIWPWSEEWIKRESGKRAFTSMREGDVLYVRFSYTEGGEGI